MKIYNSMTQRLEQFKPRNGNEVKIFTCGPSIYQKPHLGNYRTFLYEDTLVRYLKYRGYDVERSMNLTNIEDKAINEAKKKNTDVKSLTDDVLSIFHESLDGFGFIMPEHLVPATSSIDQSVKIIKNLVEKGYAYEHKGDYFFDPLKVKNFGRLFRLDMSRWPEKKRRFKKDTYTGNRWNLGDFILWHCHKNDPDHPYWETEIGIGRPSWNIQDPAVVTMTVGNQVDINCGGIDNIYRHHDYNIAIMEAYTGMEYSKYYMHGEHLIVEGKSMSKSRGNIIYPEDLAAAGVDWSEIRFYLTYTHYRKKLNHTTKSFNNTIETLHDFRSTLSSIKNSGKTVNESANELINKIHEVFREESDNDLAIGAGFDAVHKLIKKIKVLSESKPLSDSQKLSLDKKISEINTVFNFL